MKTSESTSSWKVSQLVLESESIEQHSQQQHIKLHSHNIIYFYGLAIKTGI